MQLEKKTRILHVATGFPISFPGGVTNYVRSLAISQRESGYTVDIIAGTGSSDAEGKIATKIYEYGGVMTPFSLSIGRDNHSDSSKLKKIIEEYDLVHFHMLYGFPSSFFKEAVKTPYVVSLHDYGLICPRIFMVDKWQGICESRELEKCSQCVGLLEQINVVRGGAKRLGLKLPDIYSSGPKVRAQAVDGFLRRANARLAVSSKVAAIFEDAVSEAPCKVLHIGNDSAGDIPRRKDWMPNGVIRCAFIGTLNWDKGAEVFISLAKALMGKQVSFEFWGRGQEKYIEQLQNLGVQCKGSYKPDQLKSILKDVDLGLVLPVWNDNGPQVLMEFINNGVPVLGTHRGGIPDFLNEKIGFTFDPFSEINKATDWIASLTTEKLTAMNENISPLKTPAQHASEVSKIYEDCIAASTK